VAREVSGGLPVAGSLGFESPRASAVLVLNLHTWEARSACFRQAVLPLYEALDPERKRWVDRIRSVE
jgi:hypothetical protein